ncbi:MAG: class I SAM-dependent methyltransferase [Saprospiraceae bacterium]
MEKQFELLYHDLERNHWWFNSRRKQVIAMAEPRKGEKILDVGCASGLLLEDLTSFGMSEEQLNGIDVSEEAIQKCHQKGFKNTWVMDGADIKLPTNSFDLLIASDCLEHIENDVKALNNWYSLLKKGGRIVVFVPAFMSLWSPHDEVNYHYRRYTNKELVEKAKKAGFKIQRKGYWNFFLFLPIWMVRKIKNLAGGEKLSPEEMDSDLKPAPAPVNAILKLILGIEKYLLKVMDLPVGVSTYFVATKE